MGGLTMVSVSFRSSILFNLKFICDCNFHPIFPSPFGVQFFLIWQILKYLENFDSRFPSPFGVQFFLILPQQTPYFIIYYFIIFVRILKIFIFLFLNNKKYTLTPIFKVSWRLLKKIIIFVFNFI